MRWRRNITRDDPASTDSLAHDSGAQGLLEPACLPQKAHALRPYEPISPRVHLGWPDTEPVKAELRPFDAGGGTVGAEIGLQGTQQCAWLTVEVALTHAHIAQRGFAGLALEVSANPTSWAGLQLRTHNRDGNHETHEGETMVLLPARQRLTSLVTLRPGFEPDRGAPPPKLILWMDPQPKVLRLSRMFTL